MEPVYGAEGSGTVAGGAFPGLPQKILSPVLGVVLMPVTPGSGVGLRLMKVSVKKVFLWDRLYIVGGSRSAYLLEFVNVLSDTNGPGVGVRLVRREA